MWVSSSIWGGSQGVRQVPINDLRATNLPLHDSLGVAFRDVLDSGWFLEGPQASAFEREFAAYVGCPHGVAVGNGTDALELALRAAGVAAGDEVVTVANAGGYSTIACIAIGAVPHYADIDPDSLLLDVARLPECLNARTRAVVVTHLYGRVVDVDRVRDVVGPGIAIIEDCAQAHGAALRGRRVGSLGDVAAFSFYPTKNLGALGDAGMLLTGSEEILRSARALKQYGWSSRYHVGVPHGRNSRMDEVQAAVLRVKLPRLDEWNADRRRLAGAWNAALAGGAFRCFHGNHEGNVHHLHVVRHRDRDGVRARLESLGVATTIHYPVLDCDQPGLAGLPMASADLRESRAAVAEILTLPCFPGLGGADETRMLGALESVRSS